MAEQKLQERRAMKQEIAELTRALERLAEAIVDNSAAVRELAAVSTEKGEKENPPFNPPKGKDPKRKPHPACARACEDAGCDRLCDEFWAAYP